MAFVPRLDMSRLYDRFDSPVVPFDCGKKCAPHNPTGKPFCCDICQAVPAAYHQEWIYLRDHTGLWHEWRGDECAEDPANIEALHAQTPAHMRLLACLGPDHCERPFRAMSCRQFPFYPYVTSDDRLIGMIYDWSFEQICWVISNLGLVTVPYRQEFIHTYDELFALWPDEADGYAILSEQAREYYAAHHRRIPLLHRNGGFYLVSPGSERMEKVDPFRLPQFGPYRALAGS